MPNAQEVLEWMEWKEREKELKKNMTNEEWRRTCSTEEFAKWMAEEKMNRGYFIFPSMEEAIQDALDWLKEKHEE